MHNKKYYTFKPLGIGELLLDRCEGLGQIVEVCEGIIFNEYRIHWFNTGANGRYGEETAKIFRGFMESYKVRKRHEENKVQDRPSL